ncbi:unnamed protein product [Cuscuta epithymum]|uniref:mannan endo-1,4-beta-mannosidase n=1 Tax=Cuscuta epithymum TaxID=186058 RepID=A0AAV0CRL8_9ASTE|nr:unnamed protein product [Cuscuta epithymum]
MAAYLKHIDPNHLLEVGLEGFYGPSNAKKNQGVSFYEVGTDFITNNQNSLIDFATIHAYPSTWLENGSSDEEQVEFLRKWIEVHIDDAQNTLKKPMLLAEFGKSDKDSGFTVAKRDILMRTAYAAVYSSAQAGGAAAGSLFWQIMTEGAEDFEDGYEIFLSRTSSTTDIIFEESQRLAKIRRMYARLKNVGEWKKKNKGAAQIHGNGNGN